jgi:DNA helicase II / ATP-dependent DNA helicase PcrA
VGIDQSIYGFRYANFNGIEDFSTRHGSVDDRTLNQCRRCDKKIVFLADSLIRYNHPLVKSSRLNSDPSKADGEVRIVQWKNADEEAIGMAQLVKSLIDSSRYKARDILILSPRRLLAYQLRDLIQGLSIPVHNFFHEEAVEEKEAQKSITLLNLLVNSNDAVSLRFWLGMESASWLANQYMMVTKIGREEGKSVRAILDECVNGREIKQIAEIKESYINLLSAKSSASTLTMPQLIDYLFPENKEATKVLREASLLFLKTNPLATIDELWNCLETLITQPEMPDEGDFVRIMSLHKSKGLTSKLTIITSCIQGLIPNIDDELQGDEKEEFLREQRRLFYVALTRAKEYLVLSSFNKIKTKLAFKLGAKFSRNGSSAETITSVFMQQLGQNRPQIKLGAKWQADGFK